MIESQIHYSKLEAISRQMGENIQRTSRSSLVSEDHSFATALFTGDLKLAIQHEHEPEHLFALNESIDHLFEYFSFDIADGDVLLVADPYHGGTRGQALTMASPLFHQGKLVLFPVIRLQMTDLAGEFPGGLNANAFEVWQENMRITPIKLYKQGLLQRDVLRFLLANSRTPSLYESELDGMYACLRLAQEQILELMDQYGNKLNQSIEIMCNYSKNRLMEHIKQLPKEKMKSEMFFSSGKEIAKIAVSLYSNDEQVMIDFEGTSDQLNTPVNATLTTAKAFAAWPLLAPLADDIAINDGVLSMFVVQAPKGCLLHPRFPASVGFSSIITGHFISEAVTKALENGNTPESIYSAIHGLGPQVVLFPPFGNNTETEPIFLAPGYPESKNGFGPSALFGNRTLVSAEELEFHHNFEMIKREINDNQQMIVRLVNKGKNYLVNMIIPENNDKKYGSISIYSDGKKKTYAKSVVEKQLKPGDEIEFIYMTEGGPLHS